jgi:hypothetical protein
MIIYYSSDEIKMRIIIIIGRQDDDDRQYFSNMDNIQHTNNSLVAEKKIHISNGVY